MRWLVGLCASMLLLVGCGTDRPDPVSDATRLPENLPTEIDGHRVIAFNLTEASGALHVDRGESRETVEVRVGSSVTIGSRDYEVVQIMPDSGDGEGPDGWVSMRAQ